MFESHLWTRICMIHLNKITQEINPNIRHKANITTRNCWIHGWNKAAGFFFKIPSVSEFPIQSASWLLWIAHWLVWPPVLWCPTHVLMMSLNPDSGVQNGMEEPMVVAPSDSQSHPGDPHQGMSVYAKLTRSSALLR